MTEDEAKTKWCPMVRVAEQHKYPTTTAAVNRPSTAGFNCVGADCMMWRKDQTDPNEPMPIENRFNTGYCGLAGKP